MARLTKTITITAEGRDKGKRFVITELDSCSGEKWAHRAMLALSRGGFELPPGLFEQGMAGFAAITPYLIVLGFKALNAARWEELEPLLDEMMTCVKYQPPAISGQMIPAQDLMDGINGQIEEIKTRVELRKEVLMLHVSPFDLAAFQTSARGDTPESSSSDTPTFPQS